MINYFNVEYLYGIYVLYLVLKTKVFSNCLTNGLNNHYRVARFPKSRSRAIS